MKMAIHIFTFYMISLALIPCSDGGNGLFDMASHFLGLEHQYETDHEKHSKTCDDDFCTPFCVCSCCSDALDYPVKVPFALTIPRQMPEGTPILITHKILSAYTSSVWQPPKFS